MIKVTIAKTKDIYQEVEVNGHANSAPHGEDLVCAAVSAILIGGVNAIKDDHSYQIKLLEGHASIKLVGESNEHDNIVIETIVTSLKAVAENNEKYVRIKNYES